MRIISSFHDYYDGLMANDHERDLIWNREPVIDLYDKSKWQDVSWFLRGSQNIKVKHREVTSPYPLPICKVTRWRDRRDSYWIQQRIIGFCGKLYPTLFIHYPKDITVAAHCLEDVDNFIKDNFGEEYYKNQYAPKKYNKWGIGTRNKFKEWFEEIETKKDAYKKTLFEDQHSPVFVAWVTHSQMTIEYNACLNNTDFVKVFEPWAAYQEISMFMGGLATPQKEMPVVNDEIMRDIKGFDKYSFRKDPKKK